MSNLEESAQREEKEESVLFLDVHACFYLLIFLHIASFTKPAEGFTAPKQISAGFLTQEC